MSNITKTVIWDKLIQIEGLAYKARHLAEVNEDDGRIIELVKRIRYDLEDLEVTLKIE